ncbi:MAG: hypothetical protein WCX65_05090 [bacterium]
MKLRLLDENGNALRRKNGRPESELLTKEEAGEIYRLNRKWGSDTEETVKRLIKLGIERQTAQSA